MWVISTSAFLLGVPWALAYAEEEQYVQMEREQGMIRGANEVRGHFLRFSFIIPTVAVLKSAEFTWRTSSFLAKYPVKTKRMLLLRKFLVRHANMIFLQMLAPGAPGSEEQKSQPTL